MIVKNLHSNPPYARAEIRELATSQIRAVAVAGMGRPDVLGFWFGEPDGITPAAIRNRAKRALDEGATFYGAAFGTAELREALALYSSRLHQPLQSERIAVTSSGVNALMLASQALLSPGDRVVAVVPLWPNLVEIPRILGAHVSRVALVLDTATRRWRLNLETLLEQLTPGTRAVYINSPNNPTGWVMPGQDMQRLLAHCRSHGIWILSDEAYERLVYPSLSSPNDLRPQSAPSLLDHAQDDDRVIVANTFSKTWQMTGWRLGWLVAPTELMPDLSKLIEYNTSCAPTFVQLAAQEAVEYGEPEVAAFLGRLALGRETLLEGLSALSAIEAGIPDGAMYAFLRVEGQGDSVALAHRLVRTVGLGLAPGLAFGPEGEGWLRWCFARSPHILQEGLNRFERGLKHS